MPAALSAATMRAVGLDAEALRRGIILREILGGQLVQALAREESPATHEVSTLATRALEFHIERHLRAEHRARIA